ncbi:Terminase [Methylobacterium nodulans ORS 2060]|uniref:Terminase n=1 Tax=Methylobacterium nodulans (strain LMG 21967 / CNCM I-2342 / ORS 2060) TaxID=460265 RepID=B8IA94_METNO|nr:Terminase [Methylobacterium nodulans ORS 2060]
MRRTPTSSRSPADPVTAWADEVVVGRQIAGELVRHAAERHLRDLRDGPARGLHWRPDRAAHALGFFPAVLTITAGTKAGQPFQPLPWHTFVIGSLFGWRTDSGRMRFRTGWLETGKGQAKSPLMAAIGLYLMGYYGVARSEIYAIGQDRATANVLFKDAVAMCRAPIPGGDDETDSLESREQVVIRGELDNAWKIEHPATGSKFQSLANGESISGPRPTAVLADEIHEFKQNGPIETWKRAIAKMPGDAIMLLGTNTPASTQIVGTDYSEFYQKVATGEIRDDEAFALIARVDVADRESVFDNEACWPKALPALGVTFPLENIRGEVNTARQLLSTALSVKRLYFGIPIGATAFWIAEEAWAAVQGTVDEEALKGRPCWLGLDLSKKNDLTALTAVWAGADGHLFAKTWYWTTREGLADRARADQAPYDQWAERPEETGLVAVPGAVIDKTFVAAQVARLVAEHEVQFLAFDPAGMADFIAACEAIGLAVWRYRGPEEPPGAGLKLVAHGQGKRVAFEDRQLVMPRSIEQLEDKILTGTITIAASPVTYACAANAQVDCDGQGNRAFDKARSRGRIDGLVTLAMATGAALFHPTERPREYQMFVLG